MAGGFVHKNRSVSVIDIFFLCHHTHGQLLLLLLLFVNRVNGLLAVSRSFGDINYKSVDDASFVASDSPQHALSPSHTHSFSPTVSSSASPSAQPGHQHIASARQLLEWSSTQQVVGIPEVSLAINTTTTTTTTTYIFAIQFPVEYYF